ncbi:uncharacterized protein LOC135172893 [Diachasmimorpha longicaudata]|uniref:uncharacterized protein LOC135172893 n=1 Tax=Diachasmimorpha longicaudata TaxID=58733 RepID=UPI0030B8CCD8
MAFSHRASNPLPDRGFSDNWNEEPSANESSRRGLLPTPWEASQHTSLPFTGQTSNMPFLRKQSLPSEPPPGTFHPPHVTSFNRFTPNGLSSRLPGSSIDDSSHRSLLLSPSTSNPYSTSRLPFQDDSPVRFSDRITLSDYRQDDFPGFTNSSGYMSSETYRSNPSTLQRSQNPEAPPRALNPPEFDLENLPQGIETMPTRNCFLCTICNTEIHPDAIDSHVTTVAHRTGGRKVIYRLSPLEFKCSLCDVIVESHTEVRKHLNTQAHMSRRNLMLNLQSDALNEWYELPKGIVKTKNDQWLWCSLCSCALEASSAVVLSHTTKFEHRENLAVWREMSLGKSGELFSEENRDHRASQSSAFRYRDRYEEYHNRDQSSSPFIRDGDGSYPSRKRDYETMRQGTSASPRTFEEYNSNNLQSFSARGQNMLPLLLPRDENYSSSRGRDHEEGRTFSDAMSLAKDYYSRRDLPFSLRNQPHELLLTREQHERIESRYCNPSDDYYNREEHLSSSRNKIRRLSSPPNKNHEGIESCSTKNYHPPNDLSSREITEENHSRGSDYNTEDCNLENNLPSPSNSEKDDNMEPVESNNVPSYLSNSADTEAQSPLPSAENNKIPDESFLCDICNCTIPGGSQAIQKHNESEKHRMKKKASRRASSPDEQLPEGIEQPRNQDFYICLICGCKIALYSSIAKHVATDVHRNNGRNVLRKPCRTIFNCTICHRTMKNWHDALVHVGSPKHIGKRELFNRPLASNSAKPLPILSTARLRDVPKHEEEGIHVVTKGNAKQLICTTCGCRLLQSGPVANHIESIDHKMNGSNVIARAGKSLFKCRVCDCFFQSPEKTLIHVRGKQHAAKKAEEMPQEAAFLKALYKIPEGIIKRGGHTYWCQVCNIVVGMHFKNVTSHVQGSTHVKLFEDYKKNSVNTQEDVPTVVKEVNADGDDDAVRNEPENREKESSISTPLVVNEPSVGDGQKDEKIEADVATEKFNPTEFSINDFIVKDECYGSDNEKTSEVEARRAAKRQRKRQRQKLNREMRVKGVEGVVPLSDKNFMLCLFCNSTFASNLLENHLAEQSHGTNRDKLLLEVNETQLECRICHIPLYDVGSVNGHLQGKSHVRKSRFLDGYAKLTGQ